MTRALAAPGLALALGLAACGPAERAPPAPAALDAVPALFLGQWAVLGTSCRERAPGRMDIGAAALRSGGAELSVVRIRAPSPLSVRLTLRGRARDTTLVLSGAGNVLERREGDRLASYRRCLRDAEDGHSR